MAPSAALERDRDLGRTRQHRKDRMDLRLYYAPGACSLASHIALEEAGASFQTVRLSLPDGEQRRPDYLAINPRGRVPTLVVDGVPIGENIAILTTIAALFPRAELLPAEPVALGRAYERMSWLASTAHVSIAQIWRTERFTSHPAAAERLQQEGRTLVAGHFATIEAWFEGDWVLDRYSVLDAYVLVFWRWGQRLAFDPSHYPKWRAHTARMLDRAAVAAALEREQAAGPVTPA
jgi:glutathione S-transferase